jgi:hypothetical protein
MLANSITISRPHLSAIISVIRGQYANCSHPDFGLEFGLEFALNCLSYYFQILSNQIRAIWLACVLTV